MTMPRLGRPHQISLSVVTLIWNVWQSSLTLKANQTKSLDAYFQEFQERWILHSQKIMKFANLITRVQTWDSLWMKLMALWVVPFQSDEKLGQDLEDIIKGGVGLDFVPI